MTCHLATFSGILKAHTYVNPMFGLFSDEDMVMAQFNDHPRVDTRQIFNKGMTLPSKKNKNRRLHRILFHSTCPSPLRQRVLHIHHYAILAEYPGARRLYRSIPKDFYCPALAETAIQLSGAQLAQNFAFIYFTTLKNWNQFVCSTIEISCHWCI